MNIFKNADVSIQNRIFGTLIKYRISRTILKTTGNINNPVTAVQINEKSAAKHVAEICIFISFSKYLGAIPIPINDITDRNAKA